MPQYDYDGAGEVVVLSPTRENPDGAYDMLLSFYATVERIGTEVIIVVDSNDPTLDAYLALPERLQDARVGMGVRRPDPPRIMVVEGGSLTKATNEAVARIWDVDCIIGHVGDDHRFMTKGWDTRIRDALAENPGVAYAYDGFPTIWASAWWTNSIVPRTLGWLAEPGSMHLGIDDIFMDIGAATRLTYLDDVLIEHLHPVGGKVEWRPIVRGHYAAAKRVLETANLNRYRQDDFAEDIAELRQVLGLEPIEVKDTQPGFTWRVAYLLAHSKVRHRWPMQTTKVWD